MYSHLFAIFLLGAAPWAWSSPKSFLQENRLEEGIQECRQREASGSLDRDSQLSCAWIYFRTDHSDSAEKMMEQIKGGLALPEFRLLTAYSKIKKRRFEEAKKVIEEVVQENKRTAIGLVAQELSAEWYEAQGRLDAAGFIYKQVVSEDPSRGRSQWGLGRYYLARGEQRSAIRHLEKTTELWPKHLGSRFNLGVINASLENYSEAGRWLTECYKLDKSDVGVLEQIGILFEKKGMIADAIRYWQRAVALKKDSPIAKEKLAVHFVDLIDSLVNQQKFAQAQSLLQTAPPAVANETKMQLRRGVIYRNLGEFKKAAIELKAYLAANTSDGLAARELGVCYLNLKLIDQAKLYLKKATELEPENPMNHAWYGYVLESKGELEGARDEWKLAIDQFKDPNELDRASRRLATVEKKIAKKKRKQGGLGMGVVKEVPNEDFEE